MTACSRRTCHQPAESTWVGHTSSGDTISDFTLYEVTIHLCPACEARGHQLAAGADMDLVLLRRYPPGDAVL